MHNHVGTHLDTFAHIYRENTLFNNMPPPKPVGHRARRRGEREVHGRPRRPARRGEVQGAGSAPRRTTGSRVEDLKNTAKAQNVEIQKGDTLLIRTGWRKMWDQPGPDGRADPAHTQVPAAAARRGARLPRLPERHGDRRDRRRQRRRRSGTSRSSRATRERRSAASRVCRCTSTSSGIAAPTSSRS